jgi:hypothetical protein
MTLTGCTDVGYHETRLLLGQLTGVRRSHRPVRGPSNRIAEMRRVGNRPGVGHRGATACPAIAPRPSDAQNIDRGAKRRETLSHGVGLEIAGQAGGLLAERDAQADRGVKQGISWTGPNSPKTPGEWGARKDPSRQKGRQGEVPSTEGRALSESGFWQGSKEIPSGCQ